MCKVLIIGMGNLLMSDDGLGLVALYELRKSYEPRPEVCYLEMGTSVLNYVTDIGKAETLIAIDAITAGHDPGTLYRAYDSDIDMVDRRPFFLNSHGASLRETVALSRELTGLPSRIIIYGIEPDTCEFGFFISPRVKKSLKRLVEIVQKDIDCILNSR